MKELQFKSCFISASFGTDTSVLRKALEARQIKWWDQTSMGPGSSWLDVIEEGLTQSDFVCVIIDQEQNNNILFELGIAYAKRKPILAFIDSEVKLPSDLLSLTYFRVSPKNRKVVVSALDTFLQHARPVSYRRKRKVSVKSHQRSKPSAEATPKISSYTESENKTAELLQEAGFIVTGPEERKGKGADFAVWIDELEDALGTPVLVEVKAGNLTDKKIEDAAAQLRKHVANTHGRCALLIYWDQANREFPSLSAEWPLVLKLSGSNLIKLVAEGRLAQELVRMRNMAVHGGA